MMVSTTTDGIGGVFLSLIARTIVRSEDDEPRAPPPKRLCVVRATEEKEKQSRIVHIAKRSRRSSREMYREVFLRVCTTTISDGVLLP